MQLQKFGIEIRKIGNVKALYEDVDLVLSNAGIVDGGISRDLQIRTTAHALQKMISGGAFFDVCTVRNLQKLLGIHIDQKRLDVYSSIHCMSWSEMLPTYRQEITAMVLDDFRSVLNAN